MKRHDFEPARLITGLTALGVGSAYAFDALGEWDVPGAWPLLAVPAGLCLAGITAAIRSATRTHRSTTPRD
ncbi:hypothetical protein [Streptomyces sp. MST-110588]|uniref:hypothetical protein n=1 Tax=Streptomyces sp. MST-110588 TaxID=2833628 RepID=UPI001F5C2104|nr:hypothetical protein [Streptomyces sp. MST-110588]UNO40341.1 hypothetical protein KGS77_13075 [Streptomyces sp. MST-110588]